MKTRFLSLALMLLVLAALVCSCSDKPNKTDEFEELLLNTGAAQEQGESFAELIYLIISDSASGELAQRAEKLADAITLKTGVKTLLKYDSEEVSFGEGMIEILVGDSSRLIARENFKRLREGDCVCLYDRGAIVLGGKDDASTLLAIDKFESEILPGASSAALMSPDAHFEVSASEDFVDVVLNGYYVYDYKICVGESPRESEMAHTLRRAIATLSGYELDVISSSSAYGERRLIRLAIDHSAEEKEASICADGADIRICAGDVCGVSAALAEFVRLMTENTENDRSDVEIDGEITVAYEPELFSFGFVCVNADSVSFELLLDLADVLRAPQTPAICFQALPSELLSDLELDLTGDSVIRYAESEDGEKIIPVVYDAKAISLTNIMHADGQSAVGLLFGDKGEWRLLWTQNKDGALTLGESDVAIVSANTQVRNAYEAAGFVALGEKYSVCVAKDSGLAVLLNKADLSDRSQNISLWNLQIFREVSREYLDLKNAVE